MARLPVEIVPGKEEELERWRRRFARDGLKGLSDAPRDFVHRVWRAFGRKPHLTKSFKLSNEPHIIEKVRDVVGLYLDPPDKALVLCVAAGLCKSRETPL